MRTRVGLWLRALGFALLLPGTVVVLVPLWLVGSSGGRFEIGSARYVGIPLIAIGAAALLWCIADFARVGRGTLAPVDPPQFVVRSGPYRCVRNPMYIANLVILTGEVLFFHSWRVLAWTAIVGVAFHVFVVVYEEPALTRRFGSSYEQYRRQVARWRPRHP